MGLNWEGIGAHTGGPETNFWGCGARLGGLGAHMDGLGLDLVGLGGVILAGLQNDTSSVVIGKALGGPWGSVGRALGLILEVLRLFFGAVWLALGESWGSYGWPWI